MSDSPISPDQPELRLLCQLAGIKPSALAAALNNPEHFSKHISTPEFQRYVAGASRVVALITQVHGILYAEIDRTKSTRTTKCPTPR